MVKYPNVYGIDMPAKSELIASERSVEEIREIIGADRLIFQDLEDLKDAVRTKKFLICVNLTVLYLMVCMSQVESMLNTSIN